METRPSFSSEILALEQTNTFTTSLSNFSPVNVISDSKESDSVLKSDPTGIVRNPVCYEDMSLINW